jgi:hypothetical protein
MRCPVTLYPVYFFDDTYVWAFTGDSLITRLYNGGTVDAQQFAHLLYIHYVEVSFFMPFSVYCLHYVPPDVPCMLGMMVSAKSAKSLN